MYFQKIDNTICFEYNISIITNYFSPIWNFEDYTRLTLEENFNQPINNLSNTITVIKNSLENLN